MSTPYASSTISARPGETSIFYYVEDTESPYLLTLKIPLEQVTLRDFKQKIDHADSYRYYLKAFDEIVGIYKKEILDDSARLETFKQSGRIVVWLKSAGGDSAAGSNSGHLRSDHDSDSNRSSKALLPARRSFDAPLRNARDFSHSSRLPERGHSDTARTTTGYAPFQQTNRGFETDSMVSFDNQKSSYSDSEYDGSSRASTIGPGDMASLPRNERFRRKKLTKQRSNLVRASSASSVTDTVYSGHQPVMLVRLHREHGGTLGIRPVERHGQIHVESVLRGCAVDLDKRIQPGDIIVQVNNIYLNGMSTEQATLLFRELTKKPGPICLKIIKTEQSVYGPPAVPPSGRRSTVSDLLFPYQEEHTLPLDMETWLAHTEALRPMASIAPTSLYAESVVEPRYGPGNRDREPLSVEHSDKLNVVRRMTQHDSGLEVKNRMWLKIEIKNAFMGRNLVKWLKENVAGINGVKDAKRYASQLLSSGYILPSMGTTDFSEKAYYTFDFAVLEDHSGYQSLNDSLANHDLEDMDNMDSVSQVQANPFQYPHTQTGYSFPPPSMGGSTPASRRGGNGSHSSGGSGNSSERRLRGAPPGYEDTGPKQMHAATRGLAHTPQDVAASRNSFKMAMGKY